MSNVNTIETKINDMYDKAKYLDKYGGSYYGTIILFIVFSEKLNSFSKLTLQFFLKFIKLF